MSLTCGLQTGSILGAHSGTHELSVSDPNEGTPNTGLEGTSLYTQGDGLNLGVKAYDREKQLYYSLGTSHQGRAWNLISR